MMTVGAAVALWLVGVFAFNAIVDPLVLTPWDVRIAGFNATKSEQGGWDPLFKESRVVPVSL
jgi:hypothetical protein